MKKSAPEGVTLLRSKAHPMVGYVAAPSREDQAGPPDVLVVVDGAGSQFEAAASHFASLRGERPTILLAPCTVSNTYTLDSARYPHYGKRDLVRAKMDRIAWDVAGLVSLLDVLHQNQGVRGPIGITGFSGGGSLCYGLTMLRPELVRYAVPACANFLYMGVARASRVERGGPPLHILSGGTDPHRRRAGGGKRGAPGMEQQANQATTILRHLGFSAIERRRLPHVGHDSCASLVWEIRDRYFA